MSAFPADHPGADVEPSPNFGERRDGAKPDLIILHYTGMASGPAAQAWLCNPASEVSCHYVVHEDGGIVQLVREADRAWHAGKSSWHGRTDINSASIGIEIVNPGHAFGYPDFPDVQIDAVIALCRGIMERHNIPPESVVAHSDIAPGRKIDPGEKFPWSRLADAGVGHFVAASDITEPFLAPGDGGGDVADLRQLLRSVGYGIEPGDFYDEALQTVVSAFQRHHRPTCFDGSADAGTIETLHRLAKRLSRLRPSGDNITA